MYIGIEKPRSLTQTSAMFRRYIGSFAVVILISCHVFRIVFCSPLVSRCVGPMWYEAPVSSTYSRPGIRFRGLNSLGDDIAL